MPDWNLSHACNRAWLFCFMIKQDDGGSVAGDGSAPRTADPGSANGSTETAADGSGYKFPNSKKV
jgi:hypothetical protein